MKIVSTSYINTSEFKDPDAWLERINFHSGILEQLATRHQVNSIEQINYSGRLERKGVVYHFLDFKKAKLYFPWQLHRYIRQLDPDIVLVNGFIFPLQVIQLRMQLSPKTRIIIQNHAERPFNGWRKLLQSRADRCTDAYLFASHTAGKEWVDKRIIATENKIHEVMEVSSVFRARDRHSARKKLNIDGDPVFLWVGRLEANKDPLTVVKGFLEFAKDQPSAKLYMIYQSTELLPQLQILMSQSVEVSQNIIHVGKVEHSKLEDWFNAADFFVSGSHHEGSGVAVCEAMSCGCIPVLTDINPFRIMTDNARCGLLYRTGDSSDLAVTLKQAMKLEREKEREKVLAQFRQTLSFESIAQKIDQVIEQLNEK